MGGSEIEIALTVRDAPHAVEAALRMPTNVRVRVSGDRVFLSGSASGADARHLWRVTLLNERLVADADSARVDLLKSLIA